MRVFVNRRVELNVLAGLITNAAAGRGSMLLVEGPAGIGKTSLLETLPGEPAADAAVLIHVSCHAQVGESEAYGPFLDILRLRQRRAGRWKVGQVSGAAVRRVGPELLGLVPGIGSLLKTAAESVAGAVPGAPTIDPTAAARTVADAVIDELRQYRPALVVIDDIHRIDASSCGVLSYLARACADLPALIVVMGRSDEMARNAVAADLVADLHIQGHLSKLRLRGLDADAVAMLGRAALGVEVLNDEARALVERTGGHPLLVRYELQAQISHEHRGDGEIAVQRGVEGAAQPVLPRLLALMRNRVRLLGAENARLLSVASVQGERFLSRCVAAVADLAHETVAAQLHRMAADTGLVVLVEEHSWDGEAESDVYRFEHSLLHQEIYEDQSPAERRFRHRRFAETLDGLAKSRGSAPLAVLLEIARHYRDAGDALAAAASARAAACNVAATGTSVTEVATICRQGLADLESAPAGPHRDGLQAQLLELLLAATELDWSAEPRGGAVNKAEELARAAVQSADRSDDPNLRVRVRYLYGKVLLYTRGLGQALDLLRAAWEAALDSGDPTSVLLAGCEYGRQLPKVDVAAGLVVLRRAEEVASTAPEVRDSDDPVVIRAREMLGLQIGINMMDAQDLGGAVVRLRRAVLDIRERGTLGLLPIGLNYLIQAELAVGHPEEAECLLGEAVRVSPGSAWHAVNLAYCGWFAVVHRGDDSGLATLEEARTQAYRRWQANLAPLVANLQAAALLESEGPPMGILSEVRDILTATLDETRRTGMLRSEVVSLSLLARTELAAGDLEAARRASQAAVDHLRKADWRLAAVSSEVILLHHGRVLAACGDKAAAKAAVRRGASMIRQKAQSLGETERERFLRDIPVNRAVTSFIQELAATA